MRLLLIGAVALMVAACASIGRPEGGPKDAEPPVFVRSNPAMGSLNVDRNRLDLWFDENLKLEDPANKIVVSPVQKEMARVNANGRHLTVEFRDTLRDTTTYTIDFADAIRDLNEGNILDGFAFDFSTGPTIDTLCISGMLFQARNLEPAQGMVVGVYSNLADSAITTEKLERVAKTNQLGQFTIRGLKPGTYNIYAIDDRNGDWHWDRSENVAFYPLTVSPSTRPVELVDTFRSASGEDSIAIRTAWEYLPNDILLTWFNENYRSQYLRDNKRTSQRTLEFKFGASLDSMPEFTIVNGPLSGRLLSDVSVLESRAQRDSLVYWLRDPQLVEQDSIFVSARYRKTDSLDCLSWTTDTLKLIYKRPKVKEKKEKKGNDDKAELTDSVATDTIVQPEVWLSLKIASSTPQELNEPLLLEATTPLEPIPSSAWRLEVQRDSLWLPVSEARLLPDSASPRTVLLSVPWEEGQRYRFSADSASIFNIYGEFNKPLVQEFQTKSSDDYGTVILNLTDLAAVGVPDSAQVVVELLSSDNPVAQAVVRNGSAIFSYVKPATYYARAYIDLNADTLWTTGSVAQHRLPEDVFYYPKKLLLRKNWDLSQDWELLATPVDMQKPEAIKQNKPKTRDPNNRRSDDDDELEDGYDPEQGAWGNGSQYNNSGANRRQSNNRGGGGLNRNRNF